MDLDLWRPAKPLAATLQATKQLSVLATGESEGPGRKAVVSVNVVRRRKMLLPLPSATPLVFCFPSANRFIPVGPSTDREKVWIKV